MYKLKQLFFSLFFLLTLWQFSFATTVFAQDTNTINNTSKENFVTSVETTYAVARDGNTRVSHHFRITNKTPTIYLKQYAVKSNYFGLQNIIVKSGSQEITPNIVSNENGTSIGITFEDDVVGQGKVRDFFIEYQNPDIATIAGNVLEIHIPGLGADDSFDSNKAILLTPVYFSLPVRVTPTPISTEFVQTEAKTIFDLTNTEQTNKSISAIFGTEQNYKMTLRYNLENPSSNPGIAQIALPPDTQHQKLHYHSLDPLPDDMKQDPDGNWIASYKIAASSVTVVHLTAQAKITLEPNTAIPIIPIHKNHTSSDKYWESTAKIIQDKAQEFSSPEQIYNHVIESLTYSRDEVTLESFNRYGAVAAFQPENLENAVCQEFTDTFIAIARAANIPARRLVGYAYSQNTTLRPASFGGDILHAWPEYFDQQKNAWIQIDPTWGDTTGNVDYFNLFDLNHIVFSINGNSSTLPNPAGSYKLVSQEETKDVEVTISEEPFPKIGAAISTRMEQKKFFFIPIPGMFTISITNDTGQAWYDIQPQITAHDPNVEVAFGENSTINALLPFQTKTFDVTFFTKGLSIPKKSEITLNYAWQNTGESLYEPTQQFIISGPQLVTALQKQETYIYLGIGLVIITLITGSILVYRPKFTSYIRRKSQETQKQS
ncbi:transglutaminase domain-containing protein [Candidatus Woesebacteria bacterium]|nr:transglutaminase domain-containing protein [Candidatus Woesebacteria bacterium]